MPESAARASITGRRIGPRITLIARIRSVRATEARLRFESCPYGLRRRKNCAPFVAGTVTHLFVPSSLLLALFDAQLADPARAVASSRLKSALEDGQESLTPEVPE